MINSLNNEIQSIYYWCIASEYLSFFFSFFFFFLVFQSGKRYVNARFSLAIENRSPTVTFWKSKNLSMLISSQKSRRHRLKQKLGTLVIPEMALTLWLPEMKIAEPPHLDLHCLPSSLWILNIIKLLLNIFWKFADKNFVICSSVVKELKAKHAGQTKGDWGNNITTSD